MAFRTALIASSLAASALAQSQFIIPDSLTVTCDGTIRPDWNECENELLKTTFDGAIAGPDFFQGQAFVGKACQIRTIRCAGESGEFPVADVSASYGIVRNECKDFTAGGTYRSADLCVLVDDPNNPFANDGQPTKRELLDRVAHLLNAEEKEVAEAAVKRDEVAAKDVAAKEARRDLVAESRAAGLSERQECQSGECFTYEQATYIQSVRGPAVRVCDNILPDKARCDKSKSQTTTETFSTTFELSTGIKDVVDASASFTQEVSESTTETLTTAITIDCPGGQGYIVWYPLFDISKGNCFKGTKACDGFCFTDGLPDDCELRKPIVAGGSRLSGEYAVQCL